MTQTTPLKPAILFVVMFFALGVPSFGQDSARTNTDEENTIRQLQQEWINDYLKGDVTKVSQLEADDYTAADETGLDTKREQIEGIKKRKTPDLHIRYELKSCDVRFYGPVALVTSTGLDRSTQPGNLETTPIIATTIWTRHDGQWKIDHIQYSVLKRSK